MATNAQRNRVVRTYARDLAVGDQVYDIDKGHVIGSVASVPFVNNAAGRVTFHLTDRGGAVETVTYRDNRVVRIVIERRTS